MFEKVLLVICLTTYGGGAQGLIFLALGSCFFYARRLRIATRWLLLLYITRS